MGMYYGYEDGIKSDRSVADAVDVIGLTSDMDKVKMAVESLSFLKGFTRMAHALTKAAKLFPFDGREMTQSAVLTLTDGKPSFLLQTAEKVVQLTDKHTKLIFASVTEFKACLLRRTSRCRSCSISSSPTPCVWRRELGPDRFLYNIVGTIHYVIKSGKGPAKVQHSRQGSAVGQRSQCETVMAQMCAMPVSPKMCQRPKGVPAGYRWPKVPTQTHHGPKASHGGFGYETVLSPQWVLVPKAHVERAKSPRDVRGTFGQNRQ